jgi:hypothetical protein
MSDKEILELFNEKVEHLFSLSAVDYLRNWKPEAIVEFVRDHGWDSVFGGPSEEQTDAFVLTMRFFIQDNEPISLRNMRNRYPNIAVTPELVNDALVSIDELNAFLDQPTQIAIDENGPLTHRDVMDIFVYGSYAHSNRDFRKIYSELSTTPFFPIIQVDFQSVLISFIQTLAKLKEKNTAILGEL